MIVPLLFAAAGWLIAMALIFFPAWAWIPLAVSLAPVVYEWLQWRAQPGLVNDGEVQR